MAESNEGNAYQEVEDVKPIISGIELEEFNDPADPKSGKVFRAPDDGDTSTVGDDMFHPETRKRKSTAKTALKFAIVIAVVVVIIVAIVCLVIFLGPQVSRATTAPVKDTPSTNTKITATATTAPTRATPSASPEMKGTTPTATTRTTPSASPETSTGTTTTTGTTTATTPRKTTPSAPTMSPTVVPGIVVGDVDVALSATLNGVQFIPAYNDPSSPEFMDFAGKAEAEMMTGLQNNDELGNYVTNVNVTALRDGSVIVDATISVSGDIAMALVSDPNATSATDLQLMVANQVSNSANEAVMGSLSNNPALGSSDVTVEVQDVSVPVNVGGVNLPDSVTPGEPCDEGFFRCNDGTCIAEFNRCNYLDDCEMGEDELNCGACTSNQYMCQNTKCIPNYWVCDYRFECPDGDDEIGCGEGEIENIVLVEGQSRLVNTPTYPNPYPPHVNSYWSITTQNPDHLIQLNFIDFDVSLGSILNFENGSETGGPIMDMAYFYYRFHPRPFTLPTNAALMFFYAGPYGGGRGFQVELNAVDSALYAPGTCAPGEYQCPIDGECIPSYWQCDDYIDCADGMDEDPGYCATHPSPGECTGANHQYQCDDGSCIHGSFRCDYIIDCNGGDDEMDCPCDGDGFFDCGVGDVCIPDYFVCDWFFDCAGGIDESSCHSPNFTDARFLSPGQSMNFSSPNYPSHYEHEIAYLFTFQTNVGYQIQINVYDFYAELGAFVTIGDGLDPSNHNSALVAYHHFSSPISVTSSSRSVWISVHGGPYGFGVFYASATSIPLTCEDDEYACPAYCIPRAFRCDFFHDCIGGEDEFQCGHEERIDARTLSLGDVQPFTSPDYPSPYLGNSWLYYWSFDGSGVEGDYIVKFTFHPYNISASSWVAFGSGLDFTNWTSYYAVYAGQRVDLDLYNHYSIESQVWVEFYTGTDTALYPGFSATAELVLRSEIPQVQCLRDEYACSNGIDCIPGQWQCDGRHDCPQGEDESDCDECTAYQFECPEKCIPSFYRCDFFPDCDNYEDELNCGHPPVVHQDITVDGSFQFTSPFYPNNYTGNGTFYPYTFSTNNPSRHIQFDFSVFQLGDLAGLAFGTGRDYFDASTTFNVYHARVPPTTVYAPSDVVWVDFFTGYQDNQGFVATVTTYPAGLIPPMVTCNTNQWQCLDGVTCIPAAYRCDGYHDCPEHGEDEHGCPSVCREYEFECKNGECLPIHAQCNGVEQCSEGEDEVGCGSLGECTDQQFRCSDGTCILAHQRCNYFYDCPDGSDESQQECGVCDDIYEYTCGFGNCIPAYWQCDYFYDCAFGDDEMSCHILNDATNITLMMHQQVNISSQNYPYSADHNIYQLWHITAPEGALIHFDFVDFDLGLQSFLVFSDGHMVGDHNQEWAVYFYRFNPVILLSHNNTISIQYHSGAYVGTRGFLLSMRAVHEGHVHPPCESTAYQCAEDQECIPAYWVCNGFPECIAGDDEANCTDSEPGECGVHANEYKCEDSNICFHADFRCDYQSDCPKHDDEFNCTCKESDFRCPRTGQCIPAHSVCDFYYDCIDGTEDETIGCGTPSTIMSQTLQQEELYSIQSTNYPENYPPRDYVVHLITAPDGYVARVIFNDFSIDWKGFLVFGRGSDYQNHSQAFAVYNHHNKPTDLYTPTNSFYIVFHGGPYGQSRGFNISMIPIEQSTAPTVAPVGTCSPGDFACLDGTCYPGYFECDGLFDCLGGEDEARCYASGGTCQSHQFTCNDGTCIHDSWRCDVFVDCSEGEDEQDCSCNQFQFTCNSTGDCIPAVWQCDYYPDCPAGEDEASCGECEEDQFTCSDGACIPHYYVCDGYYDCLSLSDEMDCGTPENTESITLIASEERQVQSPGYPMPHDTLCYYLWIITVPEGLYVHVIFHDFSVSIHTYLSLGTGSDPDNSTSRYAIYYHRTAPREAVIPSNVAWMEYHCGHFANGRGFDMTVTTTNISTHVFPDCVEGEVQCYDGHCIPSHFLCDTERDCSMGEDEGHGGLTNCSAYDRQACGNHETEFECNTNGTGCIHADYVCDYIYDCPFGEDEFNCPRNCTEHEFQCQGGQCIPLTLTCNFFTDCLAGADDELNCGTPQNTEYIYLDGNSTILTSPNYPGNYPKNTYRVTHVSTVPGKVIQVTFNSLELSLLSYLAFGNGNDTHDFTQIFDVYTHKTVFPSSIYSSGSELFIEFFTGIYADSQGYNITLEAVDVTDVTFPPCAEDQFQCVSDGSCITIDWLCDLWPDCADLSDEENCQPPDSTCSPDQFQCNDGQCIPGDWRCDFFFDCTFGEDEADCGFTCPFGLYACEESMQCIPPSWQCDYYPDCDLGEDETSCGECGEGFFNCSDGACVPDYYVCDAYNDCFTELDEQSCGNPTNTEYITLGLGDERNIQSPGYPDVNQHDSLCYVEWIIVVPEGYAVHLIFNDFSLPLHAWLEIGTGMVADDDSSRYAVYYHRTNPREVVVPDINAWISYHCGLLGLGRGFDITLRPTNITTHNYTACVPGEFQCNDGHCIPSHYLCDTDKDCSMAEDEDHTLGRVNCSSFDHTECGTHETEFQCPDGSCIHADYRCDQIYDCPTGGDEIQCPACDAETTFQCANQQCIHINKRCDFFLDCLNDISDELNCGTPESTTYIYLSQNSTNITSPNYPQDYPANEYTVWKIRTDPGRVIRVIFYNVDLSISTYLAFGRGTDTQDFSTLFEAYTHQSAIPAELYTVTNELFIEFHSGIYASTPGFFIGLEDSDSSGVTFPPCGEGAFQCPSDGACIPDVWECDGFYDCGFHGDEIDCQAQDGTCKPHQFTCDDGMCIHGEYQCDFFQDCSDNSDEAGCPFGCPFGEFQFACNSSRQCVFLSQVCNYIADCDLGEDEADCGICDEGFLTCSNGACVPNYWQCDGENDCFDGSDEVDCGSIGSIENLVLGLTDAEVITYPGNSMLHEANCYVGWQITIPTGHYVLVRFHFFDIALGSYLTMGTGLDHSDQDTLVANYHHRHRPRERVIPSNQAWIEFHCGPIGRGQGFSITVSPVDPDTHMYPACDSDQYRCVDESCIETFDLCNGQKDCLGGEDEDHNCTEFNHLACGTHDNEYLCPDGFYCIHGDWRCDGVIDCFFGGDELNCNCSIGEFECPDGQCIPGSYYCDGFVDCLRGNEDEMDCGTPNNTMSYNITGPMNITSPNYPNYYPVHDYALTLITVDENSVVQARILDFDLSHTSFVTFRNGHDTEAGSFIERLAYSADVIEGETAVYSMGTNMMAIEFHSGFYSLSRGFLIEVSASLGPTCSPDEFTCEDGTCIPSSFVCDFWYDCPGFDYSDENNCQAPEGGDCGSTFFTCNNGECITLSYVCDFFEDCLDGEDEEDCPAK